MSKGHYVCQRAAHAIIAEIGPFRVSSDALSSINSFLDEFIALLVMSSVSLDLVLLKTAVIQLLPHSLGKNALVEAEIELKHQVDSKQYDFTSYEQMRNQQFPTEQLIPCLQLACTNHCTLATDKNHASPVVHGTIGIAPVVVIYVTTIVEHIAEYVLNSVAMTADQADAEHIRVKEVLVTLLDDPQVSKLFRQMNLKDILEKRAYSHTSYLPTPSASPISRDHHTSSTYKDTNRPDISFNEFLEDEVTRALPSSNSSMRSSESMSDRALSILSNGTVKSSSSKSRFNFFSSNKEKRNSISFSFSSSKKSPIASPTNSTFPSSNDFDDLIRSGNTKKVTLTPNRLRSIEVKEEEVTPWERFKSPARTKKRSTTPPPPIPPLPRLNKDNDTSSPPLTPASSVASRPSQKSRHSIIYEEKTTKSNNEELLGSADTKKEEKLKPRFERPSSMVVKRASMGSRPPSFHENAFMDLNLLATAGTVVEPKSFEDLKTHYERRSEKPKEQADLIYVIPNRIQSRFNNNNNNNKPRTVDRACQTEPIELHTLVNSDQIDEEDEEWFIEEEEWEDDSEEEKTVAEWLLGNV
ncbi:hypothetical protein HPULCUR_000571 [Helicostylum pulchrum]|uniref:Uncharacterized protein n=1 Tax=Helicostylum pulchrum TaxID=562976 RepID=A0ABP9XME2_9FUNG